MKQNILKRFKEIHEEHDKELKRIKVKINKINQDPFDINLKKYKLFKDSLLKEINEIPKRNYNQHDNGNER